MKPLKLVMQAFGPFPKKVEIDFEKLGNGNIYLISGVTGSGKTTIFDAICYALFNSSSGQNRGSATFRSHFAQDDIKSFVEFSFLFNEEKYVVLRHPTYERKKTKGVGFIQEQASAQITLPNGKIIEKVKEVDEFLQELLGLNVSQFSQIALLAQGEFLKLLNADTQARAEVFRNIFKTWNYVNFQNKLKDEMNFYKNEYENIKNSILQYIGDIQSENERLIALKESYLNNNCFDDLEELISLLNLENANDFSALNLIKDSVLKCESDIKILRNDFSKIQNKISILKQKEELEYQLNIAKSDYLKIEAEYKTLDKKKKELQDLFLKLENYSSDYEKIEKIKHLEEQKAQNQEKLKSDNEAILKFNNLLLGLKTDYLKFSCTEINLLQDELKNKQNNFLKFQSEVELLSKSYLKNYNDYLKQQAGILAKDLKDGKPCPVCGSISHPAIAKLSNENLNENFINNLKNELDKANLKLAEKSKECSILNEKIKTKNELFEKLEKNFKITVKNEKCNVKNLDFEKEIQKIENEISAKNNSVNELILRDKEIETKIKTLSSEIKSQIDQVLKNHAFLVDSYNKLDSEIKKIDSDYHQNALLLSNNKSKIQVLVEQLEALKDIDTDKLEEISQEIAKYEAEILKFDSESKEILIRKTINDKTLESIKFKNTEYKKISKLYADYKILSDCANGNLKGCARIPFEQYIQSYYLDIVLCEANKHLKVMTQNQFQLIRKKEVTSLQSKTGLDLEVIDFHTFKKRSTKTLSGGESFKAALSLALGLSDCVSNHSGVMNINAMFIDEGFGSLDSESLELAMDVIFSLSTNNRLIGIISHIDDLKNKIQNLIITKKTDKGSSLEVNF